MLRVLAITTLVFVAARLLGTTRFFFLAFYLDDRRGYCRLAGRSRCGSRCRGFGSSGSLTLGLFFGLALGFFLGLQALGLGSCPLSFQLTLLLGLELFRAALDEGLLLSLIHISISLRPTVTGRRSSTSPSASPVVVVTPSCATVS